ncbi:MAG: hypothetical protein WC679_13760 [Bacteroidales bacterium]|jgi:hypothetical protein
MLEQKYMIVRNLNGVNELEKALAVINKKYNNNIQFNRHPEYLSKNSIRFTLKVIDSKKDGARTGFTGRRLINACWHVHGNLFDALFEINPQAVVISRGKKITIDGGNWEDGNIGSMIKPLYFSEACNC